MTSLRRPTLVELDGDVCVTRLRANQTSKSH